MRRYTVILTPEPDGSAYNVTVPVLPGCFTFGATVDEALAMAEDAIATYLDGEPAAEFPALPPATVAEVDVAVEEEDGVLRAGPATTASAA